MTATTEDMMTRAEINATILKMVSEEDREELQYRINAYAESREDEVEAYGSSDMGEMDELDAFFDLIEVTERYTSKFNDDAEGRKQAKADHKRYLPVMVAIGFYHEISDQQARDAVKNGINVKMSHFPVINGKRYDSEYSYGKFLEDAK